MRFAGIIRKAHRDLQVRVRLVVQPVNAALAENGSPVTANAMASARLDLPRPLPPVTMVGLPNVISVGSS